MTLDPLTNHNHQLQVLLHADLYSLLVVLSYKHSRSSKRFYYSPNSVSCQRVSDAQLVNALVVSWKPIVAYFFQCVIDIAAKRIH